MNFKTFIIMFILGSLVSCASNRELSIGEEKKHRENEANATR